MSTERQSLNLIMEQELSGSIPTDLQMEWRVDGRGALGTWFQMEAPGCSGLDPKHTKPEAVMGYLTPSHLQKR